MIILGVAALMSLASCSKDHNCRCTATDGEETYVDLVSSTPCSRILSLGFENQIDGQLVRTMKEVTCEEAK